MSKQTPFGTTKTTSSQQFNFMVPYYEFHKLNFSADIMIHLHDSNSTITSQATTVGTEKLQTVGSSISWYHIMNFIS